MMSPPNTLTSLSFFNYVTIKIIIIISSFLSLFLLRVIGRGSYAKVLMVELKKTRRIYAMKVIKKALVTDDEDIDWVQTEKHVFETASNHPFLVGLHSCFQTPSR